VAVTMPSRYSSAGTRSDAAVLAENLGVEFLELPIAEPMAVYDTADAVDKVAPWYADKYSYPTIADNFSSVPPPAYYTQGEIQADLANLKPVLEKLGMSTDLTTGVGKYRGAYIRPQETLPRVSIQRPYFDLVNHKLVDRTLIVMVREGQ